MNCRNCGASVPADVTRCVKCGSYLEAAPAPPREAPSAPASQQEPAPETQPVGPAVKSKVTAGVLGILLGEFGAHRFYLGYTQIALVQLLITVLLGFPLILACGIGFYVIVGMWIWGLVEGICILSDVIDRDAQNRPLK